MKMTLTSNAFTSGQEIPERYTCDGRNVSPPLAWHDIPGATKSLALIVDDPDAPDPAAPKMDWVHWVVYNIPPTVGSLPEGGTRGTLPAGAVEGLNDWNTVGYRGPCPPVGRHRYYHRLFALDITLSLAGKAGKSDVEQAMRGHVLGGAELIGTYQRLQE